MNKEKYKNLKFYKKKTKKQKKKQKKNKQPLMSTYNNKKTIL